MTALIIEAERTSYSIGGVHNPITVGQLKSILEDYDNETPIYLSHDEGYTYGPIDFRKIEEIETEDEE